MTHGFPSPQGSRGREWRTSLPRVAAVGVLLVAATGCYTTSNTVRLSPIDTSFPVSASQQYRDDQGRMVTEDDYQVVRSFKLTRKVEAPVHTTEEQALTLTPDLSEVMAQGGGDALTNVKIEGANYETGSHGSAASFKILGWTFGLMGVGFLGLGAALSGDRTTDSVGSTFLITGGVLGGLGVLSYLIGTAQNSPGYWELEVSGNVVRRKAPARAEPGDPIPPQQKSRPKPDAARDAANDAAKDEPETAPRPEKPKARFADPE